MYCTAPQAKGRDRLLATAAEIAARDPNLDISGLPAHGPAMPGGKQMPLRTDEYLVGEEYGPALAEVVSGWRRHGRPALARVVCGLIQSLVHFRPMWHTGPALASREWRRSGRDQSVDCDRGSHLRAASSPSPASPHCSTRAPSHPLTRVARTPTCMGTYARLCRRSAVHRTSRPGCSRSKFKMRSAQACWSFSPIEAF